MAILTGVVFGLAPVLQARLVDVSHALKQGSSRSSVGAVHSRLRNTLVVTEVAVTLMLLIGAALLIRTFANLRGVGPGFDSQNVLTFQVALSGPQYDTTAILKLIEERWSLQPLTDRDARSGDLLSAFDFSQ